jgi:starch phosphorylase
MNGRHPYDARVSRQAPGRLTHIRPAGPIGGTTVAAGRAYHRPVPAGAVDLERCAAGLASRLPGPLAAFAHLAYNYRWSWTPGAEDLFRAIDPHRWELCGRNPVRLLQEASADALTTAAANAELVERAGGALAALREDLARPPAPGPISPERPAAFFCAEYAVHSSLPIYSGGLGALAGDLLKAASDRALPLVAVGLMYRRGYFRQQLDLAGWQREYWVETDPERQPAALVTVDGGEPLTVCVPIFGVDVTVQIWRVDVGRVPLYLLDAERPENDRLSRWITAQLYVGDPVTRLGQYALLGLGGARALEALGVEPGVVHLNEGHAAFVTLELAARELTAGASVEDALDAARSRTIFTTHTPVPAGNDTYPGEQIVEALGAYAGQVGLDAEAVVRLGRTHPDDPHEPFGVTQFALRTSRAANAVSARHGEVAREMWQPLWPDRAVEDVPIRHVTNGVHTATWLGAPMREVLDRHLGPAWMARVAEPETWRPLEEIPDDELWAARRRQRAALVDLVRDRAPLDRLARGEAREYVEAAVQAFDPDALTLGFARRLATYKRLDLLLQDPPRALGLLNHGAPIQIVIAGKAHPRDDPGKQLIQRLLTMRGSPGVGSRIVFLHDYDLELAAYLVQGCDVWINVPRPPLEASGTSGMKSAINGGLQLSVLDGWWPEAYPEAGGWALSGEVDHDHAAQDARHGAQLLDLLEREVIPAFYDGSPPGGWLSMMRRSMGTIGPRFSADRMVADYVERMYSVTG